MNMPANRSMRKNAAWVTTGSLIQVICQFSTLIVLARLLSPYEFGILSIAALATQLALIFCEFGIGPYVVQRLQLDASFLATSFWLSCVTGTLISGAFLLLAPTLTRAFSAPELEQVLQAYSIIYLLFSLSAVRDALIQREMDFHYLARADAISFILGYAGVSITCAFLGCSYWSMVIGHISQLIIRCALICLRPIPHLISIGVPNGKLVREILQFGAGQTLSRLASFIAAQADSFIISSRLGVTEIGLYGRANQLVTMPAAQLGQIFDKLIFPYIARKQQLQTQAAATYRTALTGICLLSFPASVLVSLTTENLVHIILGDQWKGVVAPMQILALAIPFRLLHKVSDPTARAMGRTYSRAWRQWLVAFSVAGLTWIFCKEGLAAVAWGIVASAALDATLMVWLCCNATGLTGRQLAQALTPGILTGALVAALIGLAFQITPQRWLDHDIGFLALATVSTAAMVVLMLQIQRTQWR